MVEVSVPHHPEVGGTGEDALRLTLVIFYPPGKVLVSTAGVGTLLVSFLVLDSSSSRGGSLWYLRVLLEGGKLSVSPMTSYVTDVWIFQDLCRSVWQGWF